MEAGAVSKIYLKKKLFGHFLLAQNLTNLIYMLLALYLNNFLILNTGIDNVVPLGEL